MPKVRDTPQQQREKALMGAVYRCRGEKGIQFDKDLAAAIDMNSNTFGVHQQSKFQRMKFADVCKMARRLGLTGREWCAAAGIPYEEAWS